MYCTSVVIRLQEKITHNNITLCNNSADPSDDLQLHIIIMKV